MFFYNIKSFVIKALLPHFFFFYSSKIYLDKESLYLYNRGVLATIAQLAEHLIRNEMVVGSNPISGSMKDQITVRLQRPCGYFFILQELLPFQIIVRLSQ